MTASGAEVLGRLRLIHGQSHVRFREFVRQRGRTQLLTVGSDVECDWCVQDASVAPVHFSLHADGTHLSIADTHGAGRLRLDGVPVGQEWRRLYEGARIEFGGAVMVAQMAGSQLPFNRADDDTGGSSRTTWTEVDARSDFASRVVALASGPDGTEPAERSSEPYARRGSASSSNYAEGTTLSVVDPSAMHAAMLVGSQAETKLAVDKSSGWQGQRFQTGGESSEARRPGTGLALHRGDDDASLGAGAQGNFVNLGGRAPKVVVVLSPGTADGSKAERSESERPSFRVPSGEVPPSWGVVAFGVLAVLVGYGCWLYLLHHL